MPNRSNSARYLWGDRSPISAAVVYTAYLAPAGWTVRATYTVPTGKKAQIHGASVFMHVATVAAPAGSKHLEIDVTISAVDYPVLKAFLGENSNVAGMSTSMAIGQGYSLLAGQTCKIQTYDGGTGGTTNNVGAALITEYDG